MKAKIPCILVSATACLVMIILLTGTARSQSEDEAQLRKLQEIIQRQKELIKEQSKKIEAQSKQIKKQWEVLESVQRQLEQLESIGNPIFL